MSLAERVLLYSVLYQKFSERVFDAGRLDEEKFGKFQIPVVLEHAREFDGGSESPVESVEIGEVESFADLYGAVAAEIEQYDGIAVLYFTYGLSVFGNDERGKILVYDALVFGAVGFDRRFCRGERPARAVNVNFPARFDHVPVGAVTVHRDFHSAAARGDLCVERGVVKLRKLVFEHVDVGQRRSRGNVSAVQKDMYSRAFYALFLGFFQHAEKVRDVGVDVAVGKKPDKMKRSALKAVRFQLLPRLGAVYRARSYRFVDQFRALRIDLSASESVVPDLGVSHILVGGKPHRFAVRPEVCMRALLQELVQSGSARFAYGVADTVCGSADAVHYDQYDFFIAHSPINN